MCNTFLIGLSTFFTSSIFVLNLILLKNSFQQFVFSNISVTASKFHVCIEMLVWPCSPQLRFYLFLCFIFQSSKLQFIYFFYCNSALRQGTGILRTKLTRTSLISVPCELSILQKEHFNRWYSLKSYYVSITLTDIPVMVSDL